MERALVSGLRSVKRDGARKRKVYVYDRQKKPLGIVTFEPCNFDPRTGRRKRT